MPDAGAISVAVAPTSINVAQGGTGNAGVTVGRTGAFTGAVTLTQTGAPTGVAVAFAPALVPSGTTASTANLTVAGTVTAGTYPIVIKATGDNVPAATSTLSLVVVGAGAGSIALTAAPATITVPVGAAAVTSVITIARTAPFAGAVAMTVTGQPAGVTATLTPTSATGTTSTLSIQAVAGAVNGQYPLVVHGAGTGVATATTTVTATVTGGVAAGVALTFSPASVPVTAGGPSATSTVTVTRNGTFTGPVNLAFTAPPAGITASVNPATVPTGSTTATVTVQAPASADGSYNLTLNGTGTGIPAATGTLPVVVSPAGGGGSASVTFCAENNPLWVAAQDGSGAWTRVTPTGTTYQFTFASGKGGVAYVHPASTGTGTVLSIVYGTVAEFTGAGGGLGSDGCGTKTVNGSVAGMATNETATVTLGPSFASFTTTSTGFPIFALTEVPDGSLDLIATRTAVAASNPNTIILRRGLSQANNSTITPALDFSTGFAPTAAFTVAVGNLLSDQASISSSFDFLNGSTSGDLGTISGYAGPAAVAYNAVPLPQLNAGELQDLTASTVNAATFSLRSASVVFHAPANKTITMGPNLSTPTVSKVVSAPIARPRMVIPGQAEYNKLLIASYSQSSLNVAVGVIATVGFYPTAPSTSWDVTVPDLSGVVGWNPAWGLQDGTPITWGAIVQGGTVQFLAPITDGSTFQFGVRSSGSTPLTLHGLRAGADPFAMQRQLLDVLKR